MSVVKSYSALRTKCYHCGADCTSDIITFDLKDFCCSGCSMVYQIINNSGLCDYYDLNQNPGQSLLSEIRPEKFDFLLDDKISKSFVQYKDQNTTHVTFYLPQIHCSSCLYLLENLYRIQKGILSSRVNFTNKEVIIVFNHHEFNLAQVALLLTKVGYEPLLSLEQNSNAHDVNLERNRIVKIGIIGFCFAYIMMLSLVDYLAVGQLIEFGIDRKFRIITTLLTIPVLFYGASEFFISAVKGIRTGFLNIDIPIALAILMTFGRSVYEIGYNGSNGYFDSMSGIVFFMLIGRYFQDKTHAAITFDRTYKSFFPITTEVLINDHYRPYAIDDIKIHDQIKVYHNEIVPLDAILSKGSGVIDYSFVTGESTPVVCQIGDLIYAGGKQLDGSIELIVSKEVSHSYLTNLWNNNAFNGNNKNKGFVHGISKYFSILIIGIGLIAAGFWYSQSEMNKMWAAMTTVLIVACPCTLLLASTYTNGRLINIFSKNKFYLRNSDIIEKLSKVNHIVFDKTGTLTDVNAPMVNYNGVPLTDHEISIVASIAQQSTHPLSKAIAEFLTPTEKLNIKHFKNTTGAGIEGWVDEKHIKVGSASYVNHNDENTADSTKVFVKIDGRVLGKFTIQNRFRPGIKELMDRLSIHDKLTMLSGDHLTDLDHIKANTGHQIKLLFKQSPLDKLNYIHSLQNNGECVAMIGDGLNDAGAFAQSDVGISVSENNNNFTPASDAILTVDQLKKLDQFIKLTVKGKGVILFSFTLSIIYNIIGLYFAVQGLLSPLIAAILMPLSSITIILISVNLMNWNALKMKFKI